MMRSKSSTAGNDALVGFTLAEVMILLLFLLFLFLALYVLKKDEEIKTVVDNAEVLQEYATTMEAIAPNKESLEEVFKELVLLEEIKAKNEVLESRLSEVTNQNKMLEEQINDQKVMQSELNILQGQLQNLKNKLAVGGDGVEMPPCWADAKTGKIEYIFDILITSKGIIVHDNALPHREQDQALLPLQNVAYAMTVDPQTFIEMFEPIFIWSKKHECRFFVKIHDRTAGDEKDLYKRLIRTVGSRFYYYVVQEAI